MKWIYVVKGTTGEYSDRSEWLVCALPTEERAQAFVTAATRVVHEWLAGDDPMEIDPMQLESFKHPMDPHFEMDSTGTSYTYEAVPLED